MVGVGTTKNELSTTFHSGQEVGWEALNVGDLAQLPCSDAFGEPCAAEHGAEKKVDLPNCALSEFRDHLVSRKCSFNIGTCVPTKKRS